MTTGGTTVLEWQKVGVILAAVLGVTVQGALADGVWVPSDTVRVMCRYTGWLYGGVRIVVFGVRYTVRSVEVDSRQRVMKVGDFGVGVKERGDTG